MLLCCPPFSYTYTSRQPPAGTQQCIQQTSYDHRLSLQVPSPAPEWPTLWQQLSTQLSFITLRKLQAATGVSFGGPPPPAASPQLCTPDRCSSPSSTSSHTARLHPAACTDTANDKTGRPVMFQISVLRLTGEQDFEIFI